MFWRSNDLKKNEDHPLSSPAVMSVKRNFDRNLDFVENDFTRGRREADFLSCFGVNSQENTHGASLF